MWLRRIVFYLSAVVIILAATVVSVFQLLTPVLNDHRAAFESWTSTWLQMPVQIEHISVAWHRYYPIVNLEAVTIYHPSTKVPLLKVKQMSAFLSIVSSIWQRHISLNGFLIKGAAVYVYQNEKGEFAVKGFPAFKTMQSSDTPLDDLMNVFSNQPKLILQQIDVFYTSKSKKSYHVFVHDSQIANNQNEHLLKAKAVLFQAVPTELDLQADWEGEVFNLKQINGHLYVYVGGLSLGQWFKDYPYQEMTATQGMVSAKNWITFQDGALQRFQTQFQLYDGRLISGKKSQAFNRLSGEIGIQRQQDQWVVAAKDILIDTPTFLWPSSGLYAVFEKNSQGVFVAKQLNIAYLNLDETIKWLAFSPKNIMGSFEKTISILQPRGNIYDLKLMFSNEQDTQKINTIAMRFANISFNEMSPYPGLMGLSGSISATPQSGRLLLATKKGYVNYSRYFSKSLMFDQIVANVNWQKRLPQNDWEVVLKGLHLSNDTLTVDGGGNLLLPQGGSPFIDFAGNFSLLKAKNITNYLPDKVLEKGVTTWLSQAFLNGSLQAGKLKLQGKLNEFPFDNKGAFLVSGQVSNIDLRYAPKWPTIQSVNGSLTFSGRKILIDVDSGKIDKINIGKVFATIPYLGDTKPAILEVVTQPIDLDLSIGTQFLMETPLKDTYAKILESLHPTGPSRLQLVLTVPLKNPDDTAVKGALSVMGGQLNMQKWGLKIDRLNGTLIFTENDITAEKLVGALFEQPIVLQLQTTQKKNNHATVDAKFSTHVKINDIENWLKIKVSDVAKGETDLSGVVHLSIIEPLVVDLASDLKGVSITLQNPYQKSIDEIKQLNASILASDKTGLRLRFNYSDLLGGALLFNDNKDQFSVHALTLILGKGMPAWPVKKGIGIVGRINNLDWNDVQSYLKSDNSSKFSALLPLKDINVTIGSFKIFNQQLKNLKLHVGFHPDFWDIDVDSAQIKGHLKTPRDFTRDEIISIQLQSLVLSTSDSSGDAASFDLKTMPAIIFYANNVKYNQLDLGKISFKTETSNRGVAINDLFITSNNLKLNGSGWWLKNGASYKTQLSGSAKSDDVSALLKSFNFDVHNYILKGGEFKYDLSWNKPFYIPELKSMSGTASLKIGKGRILEVKETNGAKMDLGRMLSIFSLQTIPRRLSFDFSDLFQSGYSFDVFQGDFSLQSGNIYTSNTHFEGPVARIGISGTIGLASKYYDLILSVTPYVTSSIPLAATIFVNPIVGVAALAANKVLGPAISKVTTYSYSVKGPWDNPTWQTLNSGKVKQKGQ